MADQRRPLHILGDSFPAYALYIVLIYSLVPRVHVAEVSHIRYTHTHTHFPGYSIDIHTYIYDRIWEKGPLGANEQNWVITTGMLPSVPTACSRSLGLLTLHSVASYCSARDIMYVQHVQGISGKQYLPKKSMTAMLWILFLEEEQIMRSVYTCCHHMYRVEPYKEHFLSIVP